MNVFPKIFSFLREQGADGLIVVSGGVMPERIELATAGSTPGDHVE